MDQISFGNDLNCFIYGWKNLANYFGIHKRTLQKWHFILPIPWEKKGQKLNHSVRIHVRVADAYYTLLGSTRRLKEK